MTKTEAEKIIDSYKIAPMLAQPPLDYYRDYTAYTADIKDAQRYAQAAIIYWGANPCKFSNEIIEHWNFLTRSTVEDIRSYARSILEAELQEQKAMIIEDANKIDKQLLDLDRLDPFEYQRAYPRGYEEEEEGYENEL